MILAYGFLRWRGRGIGYLFGPRARIWAFSIMAATAIASAGVGLLVVVATRQVHAAYGGIIIPGVLLAGSLSPLEDRLPAGRSPVAAAWASPFSRLYDRMGDDMQDWCDTRIKAAAAKPKWIAGAATYYYEQVRCGLRDGQARALLDLRHESLTHKIGIVRMIDSGAASDQVRAVMQMHPSTRNLRKHADDELARLASRLESDALSELHQFLAHVYRLGHHKLLIYPFRPTAHRFQAPTRPEPIGTDL
jgi:hypothetical protein